jgi:hypothetical protein
MQYKETVVVLLALCAPFLLFSQTTTYLPEGARENYLLERLEIKAGSDSILNFSKTKPFSRRQFIPVIEKYYKAGLLSNGLNETAVDGNQSEAAERGVRLTGVDFIMLNWHFRKTVNLQPEHSAASVLF